MLDKTLKRKYFQIKIDLKLKSYNDIDYDNDYNKIFENNGWELDGYILLIDKVDSPLNSKSLSEKNYKFEIDELFQDDDLFNSTFSHQSDDISSIVDFNILWSSLISFQSSWNNIFLTNDINWGPASIREINTKINEVKSIYQVISIYFNFKARFW